jgi:hypothetical protein
MQGCKKELFAKVFPHDLGMQSRQGWFWSDGIVPNTPLYYVLFANQGGYCEDKR